jgi:hypothetical protein
VRDHSGQALSYVYYENEPGRRSAAKLLSKDEARRIAANIAKLPEPLQKPAIRSVELIVQPDTQEISSVILLLMVPVPAEISVLPPTTGKTTCGVATTRPTLTQRHARLIGIEM